jgi:hypothetical protein
MIASAQQLELFIGEPPELHLMSLYELGGQNYATFTAEDGTSNGVWVPIPPPRIIADNTAMFEAIKEDLAERGYTYRDPCSSLQ